MTNLKSAVVSAALMALIGIITYILGVGNIFALDFKSLANIGAVAFLNLNGHENPKLNGFMNNLRLRALRV